MASMPFTEADLMDALAECFVPALRRDVVSAGLVRSSRVTRDDQAPGAGIAGVPERYWVRLTMSAPGGDDAVNAQVRASVENRLLGLQAISRVEIVMQPALFSILGGR